MSSIQGQSGEQSQQQQQRSHRRLSKTVSGAVSNGGLIRLTINAGNPQLYTGNRVLVSGVGGTVEANGAWTVTVINATTIDLQGSTFTNAYTSGGTVTRT